MPRIVNSSLSWVLVLLIIMFALNAGMVLSLRSFPSQDGPMHVYLATVTADLLSGGAIYGQYFALKGTVTPYAFNTYTLIALQRLFGPFLAEKLFVCLCIALLLGGFFAMARSVGSAYGAIGLLACPLALHKSVFLGFHNFCAVIGMTLIFCAFWMTHSGRWRWWKSVFFVLMLALLSVTHPVGVLVTGLFLVVHTLLLAAVHLTKSPGCWSEKLRSCARVHRLQLIHLALSLIPLVFISRFATSTKPGSLILSSSYAVRQLAKFAMFGPISAFQVWYYAAPQALIVIAAGALLWTALRRREWTSREAINAFACLLTAGALTMVYVVSPDIMSDAAHFDQRFPIFALLFFLAAGAWNRAPRGWHWMTAASVCAVSLFLLGYQTAQCRKFNRDLSAVFETPVAPRGALGALLYEGPIQIHPLAFSPNLYAGAHFFVRSRAILLNAPYWIANPVHLVMPVEPASNPSVGGRPPATRRLRYQNPNLVGPWLRADEQQRLDFLVSGQAAPVSGTHEAQTIAERRELSPVSPSSCCFRIYAPAVAR